MSSGFVSEVDLAEARRRRQEQWEKVRTSSEPVEAPEEPYDPRPLYQRLEEQKNKKEAEYEEAHKLKNMIRGLDDDEVGFLELVEQSKASVARQISLEEQREMREFRERVNSVQDEIERERMNAIKQVTPKRISTSSTRNMLAGVIIKKRKVSEFEPEDKNDKTEKSNINVANSSIKTNVNAENDKETEKEQQKNGSPSAPGGGVMKRIGILPGIGPYKDSSDSEYSSDSDEDGHSHHQYDLLGRKLECKDKSKKCDLTPKV